MSRIDITILGVIVSLVPVTSAWSQQAQTGQAATAGTVTPAASTAANQPAGPTFPSQPGAPTGPTTPSIDRAAIPGQSGITSDLGPAAQRQGQFTPSGQPVHGIPATAFFNRTFVPFSAGFPTVTRSPWYVGPGVVQPGVTQNQFNQLNLGYSDSAAGDEAAVALPPGGVRAHTVRRVPTPSAAQQLAMTLTALPPSRRYAQLNWRELGLGPFTDPVFQRQLELTPQQQQDFQLLANRWDQKIRMLELDDGANAPLSNERFDELKREARELVNSQLTSAQAMLWPQLIDHASDFAIARDSDVNSSDDQSTTPFR
jgi:hypothetical protein